MLQVWAEERRSDLADLVAAAKVAEARLRRHGSVLDGVVERWPRCALYIMGSLEAITGQYTEAAYRFLVGVKPKLTGEETTLDAVKKEIARQIRSHR